MLMAGAAPSLPTPQGKPKVLIFLATGCPCVFSHRETFGSMLKKYGSKVDFSIVFIDKNDDKEEMVGMIESLGWDIKYIIDEDQKLLNQYHPKVSTDCVLLTPAGKVVYKGAVDDSPLNYGQIKEFYLKNAIEDFFEGRPIRVRLGEGIGCIINYKK